MPTTVRFRASAKAEAEAAIAHYRQFSVQTGKRFTADLRRALDQIRAGPHRWPEIAQGIRRVVLNRYPYSVLYEILPDGVEVMAVAHHAQKPGYWQKH